MQEVLERAAQQGRAAIVGVVNTTPDSFYAGGRHEGQKAASGRVAELVAAGADVLDIGGESSRPGAEPVPPAEQIARITPALVAGLELRAVLSVDTASAQVARYALSHGASLINDVTTLSDPALAAEVASAGAWLILSHSRAHQSTMAGFSQWPDSAYVDVVGEVRGELYAARERAEAAGVHRGRIILDPGLGFSKNARHSLELLQRLRELTADGAAWLVGTGRKSFISAIDPSEPDARLGGTVAASLWSAAAGARLLRVHDVQCVRQALLVQAALSPRRPTEPPGPAPEVPC